MGGPHNRGSLIDKKDLPKYIKEAISTNEVLYRSVYLYDDKATAYVKKRKSLRDYYGDRHIDYLLLDIDKGQNTNEQTLHNMQYIVHTFSETLELDTSNYRVYFSGTGYHIVIPNSCFRFPPGEQLPYQVKLTMKELFEDIDLSIYMRTGLYRVPHTINQKQGLYKIPLTYIESMTSKWEDIHELAKEPRLDFPYTVLQGDGELEELIKTDIAQNKLTEGKVSEPTKIATCIQTLYKRGAQQGSRHVDLLRIASHLRRNGIPSAAAKSVLLDWNNNSLNEQEIIRQTEYAYNRGYQFGCADEILHSVCNPKCIYYRRKDYLVDVLSAQDMQQNLAERIETDFTGKSYNFAHALGEYDYDCSFYPGELITIFGPTGASKTTLAHNIALGYNHHTNSIDMNAQIPILYLSLELSDWYMHRRSLQIVTEVNKEKATKDYKELYNQAADQLVHMNVQTVAPTIDQIRQKITELQPAMVIVDYIDLVETPRNIRGEYEQIKYVSHSLSNMAVQLDIIIIQLSQVSREYSRNAVLDLYAGKGSGAIENASRKVIGLHGSADSPLKTVEIFKNTDGELFKTDLEWTPSFRLRRTHGNNT